MAAPCPSCATPVPATDAFCPSCGHKIRSTGAELDAAVASEIAAKRLSVARKWLAFVAIVTWLSGIIGYFMQSSAVDKQLADFDGKLAGMAAADRDRILVDKVGMTYDQIVA